VLATVISNDSGEGTWASMMGISRPLPSHVGAKQFSLWRPASIRQYRPLFPPHALQVVRGKGITYGAICAHLADSQSIRFEEFQVELSVYSGGGGAVLSPGICSGALFQLRQYARREARLRMLLEAGISNFELIVVDDGSTGRQRASNRAGI